MNTSVEEQALREIQHFIKWHQKTQAAKEQMKGELCQIKNLLYSKNSSQQCEKTATEWEKIFANQISDKD